MRILFCNFEYPPLGGGGGIVNSALARELAKRHEVTVLTSRAFDLVSEESIDGVRIIRVPVFFRRRKSSANFLSMLAYVPAAVLRGWLLLRREKFDIINTHFAVPTGPVGQVLSWLSGVPNVLSVHGGDIYDPSKRLSPHRHWPLRLVIRRLVRWADSVVGQSKNTIANLRHFYGSNPRTVLIPLGIDEPPMSDATRGDLQLEEDDVLFVTVGRLVARKQVDQLIAVLSKIPQSNVKLIVIGAGPASDGLKAVAKELGVEERVHWAGFVSELKKQQLLQNSDVFVSTSEHEGFGLVFLEAMAFGLPVVCYDNGGQTDFLSNGKNGFILPLNDVEAVVKSCLELVTQPELRKKCGETNTHEVRQYFIENCASLYESEFNDVLRGRSRQTAD